MIRRLLILLAMLMATNAALAAAPVPAYVAEHLSQPRLAGQGPFKWFGLRIYDAELWVGDKGYQGYQGGAPFVLDLRYARRLEGIKIAEASADEMAKLGAGTPAQRAVWLARMKEIFPDVKEGSHIGGVFLPTGGARFYLDGKPLAAVPDPEFARAFFAIWLDPNTSAKGLRAALLKEATPR
jgi:hypothetical protein